MTIFDCTSARWPLVGKPKILEPEHPKPYQGDHSDLLPEAEAQPESEASHGVGGRIVSAKLPSKRRYGRYGKAAPMRHSGRNSSDRFMERTLKVGPSSAGR